MTVMILNIDNRSLRMIQEKRIVVTAESLTRKPALIAAVSAIPMMLRKVPKPDWRGN